MRRCPECGGKVPPRHTYCSVRCRDRRNNAIKTARYLARVADALYDEVDVLNHRFTLSDMAALTALLGEL